MKKLFLFLFIILLTCGFMGCLPTAKDTVTQTSTIDALLAGVYDGNMSCQQLLGHGDFGIGTFHQLDGEMILKNGKIYQVKSNGKVFTPNTDITTPFATVCNFRPDMKFTIQKESDYNGLESTIDNRISNQNLLIAVQITGIFNRMKVRSVPAQQKPYQPLVMITKNQPVFEINNIKGTLIGFRLPAFMKGINVPGYHFHFISEDQKQGGHVLDFEFISGICEVDISNQFLLILPSDKGSLEDIDFSKDRSEELEKVER